MSDSPVIPHPSEAPPAPRQYGELSALFCRGDAAERRRRPGGRQLATRLDAGVWPEFANPEYR